MGLASPIGDALARLAETVLRGPQRGAPGAANAAVNLRDVVAQSRDTVLRDPSAATKTVVATGPATESETAARKRFEDTIRAVFAECKEASGARRMTADQVASRICSEVGLPGLGATAASYSREQQLMASVAPVALRSVLFASAGLPSPDLVSWSTSGGIADPLYLLSAGRILGEFGVVGLLMFAGDPLLDIAARELEAAEYFVAGVLKGLADSGVSLDTIKLIGEKNAEATKTLHVTMPLLLLVGQWTGACMACKDEIIGYIDIPGQISGLFEIIGAAFNIVFSDKGNELAFELGAMLAGEFADKLLVLANEEYVVWFVLEFYYLLGYFFASLALWWFDPLGKLELVAKFGALARRVARVLFDLMPRHGGGEERRLLEVLHDVLSRDPLSEEPRQREPLYRNEGEGGDGKSGSTGGSGNGEGGPAGGSGGSGSSEGTSAGGGDDAAGGAKTPREGMDDWAAKLGDLLTEERRVALQWLGAKASARLRRALELGATPDDVARWLDRLGSLRQFEAKYGDIAGGIERYEELVERLGGSALPLGRGQTTKALFLWYELLDLADQENVANVFALFGKVLPNAEPDSAGLLAREIFNCMQYVVVNDEGGVETFKLSKRDLWRNWRGHHGNLEAAAAFLENFPNAYIQFEVEGKLWSEIEFDTGYQILVDEADRRPDFFALSLDAVDGSGQMTLGRIPSYNAEGAAVHTLAEVKNFDPAYPSIAKALISQDTFLRQRVADLFIVVTKLDGEFQRCKLYFPKELLDAEVSGQTFREALKGRMIEVFDAGSAEGQLVAIAASQCGFSLDDLRAKFLEALSEDGPEGIVQGM